jgi:hypothetical protein
MQHCFRWGEGVSKPTKNAPRDAERFRYRSRLIHLSGLVLAATEHAV